MITITMTMDIDGDENVMAKRLCDYFTAEGSPMLADFGLDGWGGYEGPYIKRVDFAAHDVRGRLLADAIATTTPVPGE